MWILTVTLAMACSCAGITVPTVERCATATRAFSGRVVGYDWPLAHQLTVRRPATVHVEVDTVWAGDVPDRLTTYTGIGGGDCGIAVAPGTRLVVCDDEEGRVDLAFGFCGHPAFAEDAEEILAALPPGHAPRSRGGWEAPDIRRAGMKHGFLLLPVGGVFVGALAGRLSRRWGSPGPPTAWAHLALAAGFVLVAVLSHVVIDWAGPTWTWMARRWWAILIGSVMLGGLLGGRVGRRGGSILVAAVLSSLAMRLSFSRFHLPIQWPEATACSIDRARAFFAALPPGRADEVLGAYDGALPRSCTDLGLWTMQLASELYITPCLEFEDGMGGAYAVCAPRDTKGMLDPTGEPGILYGFGGF